MTETTESNENREPFAENTETNRGSADSQWDAVAKDFQRLGESIAEAVKSAWQNETTQRQVHDMQEGLHSLTEQVGEAVEEAKQTITSEEVKTEVKKTAEEVKGLGSKVYSETKPVLLDVLKTLDEGIRKMIERMEAAPTKPEAPKAETEETPPPASE